MVTASRSPTRTARTESPFHGLSALHRALAGSSFTRCELRAVLGPVALPFFHLVHGRLAFTLPALALRDCALGLRSGGRSRCVLMALHIFAALQVSVPPELIAAREHLTRYRLVVRRASRQRKQHRDNENLHLFLLSMTCNNRNKFPYSRLSCRRNNPPPSRSLMSDRHRGHLAPAWPPHIDRERQRQRAVSVSYCTGGFFARVGVFAQCRERRFLRMSTIERAISTNNGVAFCQVSIGFCLPRADAMVGSTTSSGASNCVCCSPPRDLQLTR
jgi:hypothetical protein